MHLEDREHSECVHGDVCLSPHVSFLDLWAVENKTFEKQPGQICRSTAHVKRRSMSAEDEALLQALDAHKQPPWQPSGVT